MNNRQGYKSTEIGELPKDWHVSRLAILLEAGPQYGLTASKREQPVGPKFLRTTDVKDYSVDWKSLPYCECPNEKIKKYLLNKGDIVIARSGSIGVSVLIEDNKQAVYGSYMIKIKPKNDVINARYLSYFLQSMLYWKQIRSASRGSTMKNINSQTLRNLIIGFPNMLEQQKITAILSIVDKAIQKTDEIIAMTQQLKKGLMQQLLTKGIGHTKFKKTEIGELPEEWKVERLEIIAESYKNGIYKKPEFYGHGIPSVRMYNISNGKVNTNNAPLLEVTNEELEQYGLLPMDIVVNRVNSIDLVGKAGIVPDRIGPATYESKNIRIKVRQNKCMPEFLTYFMNSNSWYRQIRASIKPAIAQATINQKDLNRILVPMPSLVEQRQIVSSIFSVDDKIYKEKQIQQSFEQLKKGLMQVLLTGKVRVKVN